MTDCTICILCDKLVDRGCTRLGCPEVGLNSLTPRVADATDALLSERGKTHGNFADHAFVTQRIKEAIKDSPGWVRLNMVQIEALEMIAHKIGRIVAGNPNHKDHWDDIAGYARLVSERIQT